MSGRDRHAASGGGEKHAGQWPPSRLGPNLIAHYKAEAARLRSDAINAAFFRFSVRAKKLIQAALRRAKPKKQNMICRIWHGWTPKPHADRYEAYLKKELFPRLARELTKHGYKGFHILRLDGGDEVEFLTMVWFESLQSVRSFAGEQFDVPVISPTAAVLLAHHDGRCQHYELRATG